MVTVEKTQKVLEKHGPSIAYSQSNLFQLTMSGYHRIAFTSLGVFDPKIEELASRARRDVKRGNVSRNLHFYIHKKNMTLPVATSSMVIPIKARVSRRFAVARKPWPVFHLSSWIKTAMETKPFEGFFLLAGMKLDKLAQAEDALELFWSRYKAVDPNTPDYPRRTLPFYIHGDEGRSQVKRPVLIISFQGLMSWAGSDKVNSYKTLLANNSNKLCILFSTILGCQLHRMVCLG